MLPFRFPSFIALHSISFVLEWTGWSSEAIPSHAWIEENEKAAQITSTFRTWPDAFGPRRSVHPGQARRRPAHQLRRAGFHGTDKECGQKRSKRGNTAGDDQNGGELSGKAAAGDLDQRGPGSRRHVLQRAGNACLFTILAAILTQCASTRTSASTSMMGLSNKNSIVPRRG